MNAKGPPTSVENNAGPFPLQRTSSRSSGMSMTMQPQEPSQQSLQQLQFQQHHHHHQQQQGYTGSFPPHDIYHLENTTSRLHYQETPMNPVLLNNMTKGSMPMGELFTETTSSMSLSAGRRNSNMKESKETRVRVVIRIRPPIPEDASNDYSGEFEDCTTVHPNGKNVTVRRNNYEEKEFGFDHILDQTASQEEMFGIVSKSVVDDVLQGYNGTILAYGQTGTGKTFTVFGPGTHWELDTRRFKLNTNQSLAHIGLDGEYRLHMMSGIIPRAIHQVFEHIANNKHMSEFRVTVSFLQIYMENVMDLLDSSKVNLNVREDPKLGIFVENLTTVVVQEPQDIIQLIKEGAQNRAVSSTNMNKVSSRSHVILNITLEQRPYAKDEMEEIQNENDPSMKGTNLSKDQNHNVRRGTLTIVDLAGSERVSKSGSEGQRLEEAKKINKSLSALGNCVAALTSDRVTHVPFRDSKLTRLLTDSLGGNAKTCLVATLGPAVWNYDESYSTLLFATRAMAVRNHAVINEVVDFKTLSGNLQRKISLIENEKYRLLARNVDLEKEVAVLRNELLAVQTGQQSKLLEADAAGGNSSGGGLAVEERQEMARQWEERERELVNKFSSIIQHLQKEISKNNMMQRAMQQGGSSGEATTVIDHLTNSLLAIPAVKKGLIEKLFPEFEKEQQEVSMNNR